MNAQAIRDQYTGQPTSARDFPIPAPIPDSAVAGIAHRIEETTRLLESTCESLFFTRERLGLTVQYESANLSAVAPALPGDLGSANAALERLHAAAERLSNVSGDLARL